MTRTDEPLILGIETSCDETGVGIVRGTTLLVDAVASSVEEHARFGGVVPEVASRAHLDAMVPTVERALRDSGLALADVDAVAVTSGPGLAGAAHVAVDVVEHGPLPEPVMALLVSGGHSSLLLVPDVTRDITSLGSTIDDAAGEAFDKVARVLGLPFPGGPHIDRAAREGNRIAIDFPRGLSAGKDMERHRFDFSFSGLKTAVSQWVQLEQQAGRTIPVNDVAAPADRWRGRRQLAAARPRSGALRLRGDPVARAAPGLVHRQRRHGRGARRADGGQGSGSVGFGPTDRLVDAGRAHSSLTAASTVSCRQSSASSLAPSRSWP